MKRRVFLSMVFLGFLVAALVFVPGMTRAQGPNEVVASKDLAKLSARTAAFWTEARMKAAKPMPMPVVPGGEQQRLETLERNYIPEGPAVTVGSGRPGDSVGEALEGDIDSLQEETSVDPLFGTFPFSYTRYRLFPDLQSMYTTFPSKTVGKLFFTIPGQGNFVCSGAVVNSTNQSVVWTAGHCVYTPGVGFHTNYVFAPARRLAVNPLGTWTVKQAFTLVGWQQNKLEFDHGAVVMNLGGNAPAAKIATRTGFLGFQANIARQQHWHLLGYPAAARNIAATPPGAQFDGVHQEICAATFAVNDDPPGGVAGDPNTIGVGCDQTGGTSGGPWIKDYSGVGGMTNFLNGNNSYRYNPAVVPNILRLYSPYFGAGAVNLRNAAQAVPVP